MLHAKFQRPSIYIDRYFQLSNSVRHSVSKWHTQDVELFPWPEARGTAKDRGSVNMKSILYPSTLCQVISKKILEPTSPLPPLGLYLEHYTDIYMQHYHAYFGMKGLISNSNLNILKLNHSILTYNWHEIHALPFFYHPLGHFK